jgi:hypothetical protein
MTIELFSGFDEPMGLEDMQDGWHQQDSVFCFVGTAACCGEEKTQKPRHCLNLRK